MVLDLLIVADARVFALQQGIHQIELLLNGSGGGEREPQSASKKPFDFLEEWSHRRVSYQKMELRGVELDRKRNLASQIFERDLAHQIHIDFCYVRIKDLERELFGERLDHVAFFDEPHLDERFADSF